MKDSKSIIWLFGENEGNTLNNNSYFTWEQVVEHEDEISKYYIVKKNKKNKKIVSNLPKEKKKYIVWKNSIKHWKLYLKANMFWVSLSFKDVIPNKLLFLKTKMGPKKPTIYLQHGTLAIKQLGYTGRSYNNNMFRFVIYNEKIREPFKQINEFKDYQIYSLPYHPRYKKLLKMSDEYKTKEVKGRKQILFFITWREYFGDNKETDRYIKKLQSFFENKKLIEFLDKKGYAIKLCLHQLFKESKKLDKIRNLEHVEVVTPKEVDVMHEIAISDVLITDYSSVGFDFTFLNKPVLLYQPDLNTYLKYRDTYCNIEELKKYSIQDTKKLIDSIVKEKFEVNEFFRSRMPEKLDYDFVREGKHIEKIYQDIRQAQLNSVTFIGYNFYGRGGTVSATKSLAEALLEKGYLVHLFSLKKTKNNNNVLPRGLNCKSAYSSSGRKMEKFKRLFLLKRHYSYLKYDCNKKLLIPYAGIAIRKFLENTKSKTVVSTRESLHLFLNEAKNPYIKNKIYFFHTDAGVVNKMYPNLMPEIEKIDLEKCAFVTTKNYDAYMKEFNLKGINKYVVVGNCLQSDNMIEQKEILKVSKKTIYTGITMLRMSEDRRQDIEKIIEYGKYLKNTKEKSIKIDVFGMGPLSDEFEAKIKSEKVGKYINYCGFTDCPSDEIKQRDFLVDFSLHQSFGMTYIEGILNGKKVFATKTNGSKEVLKDIPNSYFETFEELTNGILNIHNITIKELKENYIKIYNKYSRESVAESFLKLLGENK